MNAKAVIKIYIGRSDFTGKTSNADIANWINDMLKKGATYFVYPQLENSKITQNILAFKQNISQEDLRQNVKMYDTSSELGEILSWLYDKELESLNSIIS